MSWSVEEVEKQVKKILKIFGEEIDVTNNSATEVKQLILQKAREKGYARIIVEIDGEIVTPSEFDEKFEKAHEIAVYKAEVAGHYSLFFFYTQNNTIFS